MATTYTKLFQSILDSTVWQEPLAIKVVWVTLLAMCDAEGRVWASIPGLASRAGVSVKECETALDKFEGPDPYSRTKENQGRRIAEIDGGWQLLNHAKYRAMMSLEDRREYQRVKQAEYRAARKLGKALPNEAAAIAARDNGNDELADRLTEERKSVPGLPFDHPLPDAAQAKEMLETLAGKPKLNYQQGVKVEPAPKANANYEGTTQQ